MATTNTGFLDSADLDFQTLKTSLKQFLSQQVQFKDYNFEGSNLNVLLDLLTYNTTLNALYTNLVGSEMFIDSAQLRSSIVSHAKELGYCPRSRTSATTAIDVQATGNSLPAYITVPTGFQISGRTSAGDVLYFITDQPLYLNAQNNWTAANTPFYEGRIITETFVVNSTSTFVLQSANLDTSSINVSVQVSSSDSNTAVWNYSSDIAGVTSNSNVWFLQGYDDYQYQILFGDGVIGANLVVGNIVTVSYRETQGALGNAFLTFTPMSGIAGASGVTITQTANGTSAAGGNNAESNNSIVFNATKYFPTQGKAVTAADYSTILITEFPQLIAAAAYGGEDAVPFKQYGTVFLTGKIGGSDILPDSLKQQMTDFMSTRAPITTNIQVIDADVYNIQISADVTFSLSKLTTNAGTLQSSIANTINQFDANALESFGKTFYASQLTSAINNSDSSIVSSQIETNLYKISLLANWIQPQTFYFGNALSKVWSSPFNIAFPSGSINSTVSVVAKDINGVLQLISAANNNSVIVNSAGTVDYVSGTVTLNKNTDVSNVANNNSFSLFATPENSDIDAVNNRILSILPSDVTIALTELA